MPALRLARDHAAVAIRLDRLQGAVALRAVQGAFRALQANLKNLNHEGHEGKQKDTKDLNQRGGRWCGSDGADKPFVFLRVLRGGCVSL
jgi:hypothetical protein